MESSTPEDVGTQYEVIGVPGGTAVAVGVIRWRLKA
jgi:hypothetical protein